MRHIVHLIPLAVLLVSAAPAHAQPADASALSGQWSGTYECNQGPTALELALRGNAHGIVRGTFTFSPTAENPEVPSGSYPLLGRLAGTSLVLRPVDVREMPEGYSPVGIQATVEGNRLTGWIEGAACGELLLSRTSVAAAGDELPGGFGPREWGTVSESPAGGMYASQPASEGGSTARLWLRWQAATDDPQAGLDAGQALEWELEFDCPARRMRPWHTLVYAADGQLEAVDASAPFGWQPVVPNTMDVPVYEYACLGTELGS